MFEFGTMIVTLLAFLIMLAIVIRFGFKPLSNMMEQRRLYIERQIAEAEEGRAQAERLLAEHRELVDQARRESKQMVDAARARAEEQARQIVAAAEAEAERLLEENRKLIERERQEALDSVLNQVAGLTVELTGRLLRERVTPEVHQEMLKEAEKRLGELVC
ncbi:F0F1 ATP synthase subunit B [Alicyclobacillus kakegawensis]|uniref:F0F1 ATP synthase subunit B n=1 Tax=Alicyclobacillus kakegawensis TaxID=392012 RepID=UPI000AB1FDA6|nr:F0F1 ATP synthase subunit B [Alicyclobacillus kakegawensis]